VDLNPLSRTSQAATVSIVDNIVRALPLVVEMMKKIRKESEESLRRIIVDFNNQRNLQESYKQILGGFPAL
ncbi:MAG: phosphopantothenate/pantothenate synthetase family protein, partial [Candidatus Hodarchaeales archaeon]